MSISLQLPRYVATRVGYAFRDKNDRVITDPQTFYDGLAFVQTGHYALGVHGFFHGGIHIERASNNALSLKDNAIHCAADGEVVAYRIDRHYHDATPDAADGGRNLRPYSTGFVLVRHRLQAPMPPQAPKPATVENPMADRRNMGTFLYEDERGNNRLAWLPQGTPLLVELGADLPGKSSYVRVLNVMSPDVPKQGWINRVWLALDPMAGAGLRAVFGMKERVQTRVYGGDQPDPAKWDAYSRNQTELVKPAPPPAPALTLYSLYMHLGDLASYEKQTKRARPPWWPANDNAPRLPEATDRVVTLTQPVPIREGDLIGFIGEDVPARAYPIAGVPVSRLLLHLEMFSGDDVPTYLALSRRWASEHLPDSERTLLVLRKGETLHHQPDGAVACTLNRPLVLPLVGMEVKEVDGKRWRLVAKPSGGDVSAAGWVPEEGHLASPWQWPGFEVHDESFAEGGFRHEDAVAYARYLRKEAPRPPDSPFYRQLRSWLDANRDGDVSGEELQWALRNRSVAGMLGRLIVRHESEWSRAYMDANRATAQCVAEQLGPRSLKCVQDETPRSELLPWWDEVAAGVAGFPQSSRVYFFHPGGVAGQFIRPAGKITVDELRKIFTGASEEQLGLIADELNPRLIDYRLATRLRLSHFFAQIKQEAGNSLNTLENLNYRADVLSQKFAYFSRHREEAEMYGRTNSHAANPEAIANRAYAHKIGNGTVESGDGWLYRGRGLKQLTGRANYVGFQRFYPSLWPGENVDFVSNPDLVAELRYATRSAIYFWIANQLPAIADEGEEGRTVDRITAVINRDTDSYGSRRHNFSEIWSARLFKDAEQ